ncbi:amidohydrolase family protein [Shewanella cyperi]|uniref:Amidohydrolase family protein n=1 Tax=Shewanella cyperi TaxID=2814292 RepID=A0A975AL65_9GAMM|nr:amidohydrolase family protein [Shewanella cyperi]QSX31107.1 amidohydrolase family protein [Shewanella cyperi]
MNKLNAKTLLWLLPAVISLPLSAKTLLQAPLTRLTAITGATLHLSATETLTNATLVIEGNHIKEIIKDGQIPENALVIDLSGYEVYPGFIDPFAEYGIGYEYPKDERERPVYEIKRVGGNADNGSIHAQMQWVDYIEPNKAAADKWTNNGFTSVQTAKLDGIFRGRAAVVSLADKNPSELIYRSQGQQFIAFDKGSSKQDYPRSLMGAMALIRQTFSDVRWYQENKTKLAEQAVISGLEFNSALDALGNLEQQTFLFDTRDLNSQLRAARLLSEQKLKGTLLGNGQEYARLDELKAQSFGLILPLNFPKAPEVADPLVERDVSLAELRHWERAPANPALVANSKLPFAFTQYGISKAEDFWPRLRQAIAHGLSEADALAALTSSAAELAGVDDIAGRLAPGYMADLVVSRGDLFKDGKIVSVWLQGDEQELSPRDTLSGQYRLQLDELELTLELETEPKLKGSLSSGEISIELQEPKLVDGRLIFSADLSAAGMTGLSRFSLVFDKDGVSGRMTDAKGQAQPLAGTAAAAEDLTTADNKNQPPKEQAKPAEPLIGKLTQPNVAFGLEQLPKAERLHIRHATIWTSEAEGILEDADLLLADGKIERIGKQLSTPSGYRVIDASGKHLTAGIVDEHSHIAINGGTNEDSEAITAEVRIGDILNPDEIALYRGLSGGVTTAQLLHGSANPIGGQSQLIKLRWGENAEALKFKGAPASIKFALGENVKQSNWGDKFTSRFPQSRMGVESAIADAFDAARHYESELAQYERLRSSDKKRTLSPRPSTRLDAVLEVLKQQRDVHIHSYVQSEILMFLRLAETYKFKIKAFTHVLEGYKLADELAAHGAGASTFSDWWAYKFEVYDAIPQNACLMTQKGVVTSINSDSFETQRRLNQEAAKSMMYCGMSAEEAWKMVTINPAKQLGVEDKVGSIKVGKSADLVLWDNNPLSVYARTEAVWVDGKRYFDREADANIARAQDEERAALVQKILSADAKRTAGETPKDNNEPQWHCDTHYQAFGTHAGQTFEGAL